MRVDLYLRKALEIVERFGREDFFAEGTLQEEAKFWFFHFLVILLLSNLRGS